MIPSHKRLLLQGFGEKAGIRSTDNVRIVGAGGQDGGFINALILATVCPWLAESLAAADPDDTMLMMPDVPVHHWRVFASNLIEDRDYFHVDDVVQLRRSLTDLSVVLSIDFFQDCLGDPDVITDDEEDEAVTLDTLEGEDLNDDTLEDNFSDQDGRLVCLVCYQIFPGPDAADLFRNHLQNHDPDQLRKIKVTRAKQRAGDRVVLKCGLCAPSDDLKAFKTMKEAMKHHKKLHQNEDPEVAYVCETCGFSSPKYPAMGCHLRSHQERKFECRNCGQKFLLKAWLRTHLKKKMCGPESLQCRAHCGKTFATPTALKLHLRKLDGSKPFECKLCKKSFPENRSLKEHFLTHRRERQHHCSVCDKSFVQKNHLRYHMASIHNASPDDGSAKKHVCKICSRSFAFPFLLKKHEASHVKKIINHFNQEGKSVPSLGNLTPELPT